MKFNLDEEYWRWYGKKEEEKVLEDYFGQEIKEGEENGWSNNTKDWNNRI